ncbi:MAG: sigma-70 family RNA polymerase sigma factor [Candidatus Pacebacteria bacterium]|nr:sigma-70 family RNA polymerase sigma factor [Candidatus Paceibacterota bacterium]MBP9780328.1 sigma-70 family RNA polymerase sigma factor [Candidatus Paceibacterota bacterium]
MRQLKIVKSITNRESASFEKYLQEIGKEELITAQQEIDLARRIRANDQQALEKLTRANLRFVVSVAKQYQNQGLALPDLINEGNIGLIKAAKRFDETRGFKFISYAVWWIRQSILQAIAEQARIVRLPLNQLGFKNKVKKALLDLEQKLEREPSGDEIAEVLDTTRDAISDTLRVSIKHTSLDAPLSDHEESTLYDLIQDTESPSPMDLLDIESLQKEVERCLSILENREKDVIKMSFGLTEDGYSMTLEEIGERFDLTRERVRQIREKALRRLRHSHGSRLLKKFLLQ